MGLPDPADDQIALVTGASSGIGEAIATELASRGHGVALVARREERLRALADRISTAHGVEAEAIGTDLGDEGGRDALDERIAALGRGVSVLVNNAGFGDGSDFDHAERDTLLRMVRLNCEALCDLQARYLPVMVERGEGAVINISSTSAFQPLPGTATYAATKAFVLHLSEAVHSELAGSGVTVTAVCPGPVRTEFMDAANLEDAESNVPAVFWMTAEEVAREAVTETDKGRRVVVPGMFNRVGAITGQHAPRGLALPIAKRIWGRAT